MHLLPCICFALLGIGFTHFYIAESQQQAMFISLFFMMIFILMREDFTHPLTVCRIGHKGITRFNPSSLFYKVMRMIVMKDTLMKSLIILIT
ncbi:MAG: hypothetical protein IPG60_15035 [Bacteroidetes bacterium]|nr:hypothetical protein [Bacteroidota bacterium]